MCIWVRTNLSNYYNGNTFSVLYVITELGLDKRKKMDESMDGLYHWKKSVQKIWRTELKGYNDWQWLFCHCTRNRWFCSKQTNKNKNKSLGGSEFLKTTISEPNKTWEETTFKNKIQGMSKCTRVLLKMKLFSMRLGLRPHVNGVLRFLKTPARTESFENSRNKGVCLFWRHAVRHVIVYTR